MPHRVRAAKGRIGVQAAMAGIPDEPSFTALHGWGKGARTTLPQPRERSLAAQPRVRRVSEQPTAAVKKKGAVHTILQVFVAPMRAASSRPFGIEAKQPS